MARSKRVASQLASKARRARRAVRSSLLITRTSVVGFTISLARLLSSRAALLAEIAGLTSIAGGLWMVYEPAALIVAGLGCVLWAQGHRSRASDEDAR